MPVTINEIQRRKIREEIFQALNSKTCPRCKCKVRTQVGFGYILTDGYFASVQCKCLQVRLFMPPRITKHETIRNALWAFQGGSPLASWIITEFTAKAYLEDQKKCEN